MLQVETSAKVPHIIVSTKPHDELDCSLPYDDVNNDAEEVSNAWKNYHTFIETAKSGVRDAAKAEDPNGNDTAVSQFLIYQSLACFTDLDLGAAAGVC